LRFRFGLLLFLALDVLPLTWLPAAEPRVVRVESYGLDKGLSQSTVVSLATDQNGFLWAGTQEGLHRFDGHRFSVIRREPDNPHDLISSTIDELAVDRAGRLWLGSNDAGLEVIEPATLRRWRFTAEQGLSHPRILSVVPRQAAEGALVATAAGVDLVSLGSQEVTAVLSAPNLVGVVDLPDEGWLAADRNCRVWFEGRLLDIGVAAGEECMGLVRADSGSAWLVTISGRLGRLRSPSTAAEFAWQGAGTTADGTVTAVFPDAGRLLLGYSDGRLGEWSRETGWRLWQLDIGDSAVSSLHRGDDGVLWIGTLANGLHRVLPLSRALGSAELDDGASPQWPSQLVWSLLRDDRGWLIGTSRGLTWRAHGDKDWQTVLHEVPVRSIAPAGGDSCWLGTDRGLWRWRSSEAPRRLDQGELPHVRITDLLVDGDRLWVATRAGLSVYESGQFQPDRVPEPLRSHFLTTLTAGEGGVLWVGSNEFGAFRIGPGGRAEHFFAGDSAESTESVWAIRPSDEGLWLGTYGGGLLLVDADGRVQRRITESSGLPNNVIYRILADSAGRLWVSTNRGLGVLDPEGGRVRRIGRRDGLRNREFNAGAAWYDADGMMHFGGINGVDSVRDDIALADDVVARPVLAGLTVAHNVIGQLEPFEGLTGTLAYAQSLRLGYRQRIFSLRMVALDFTAPEAARLRYRVPGLHEEWIEARGGQAEFTVNYLSPGRYPLQMEAAGRNGIFGNRRELTLILEPPPWQHPFALTAYLLLLLLGLALIVWRVRARMLFRSRQVEQLNRLVAARTAELEKANRRLSRSNRELDRAMRKDPLTDLSNRRDLRDWIERHGSRRVGDEGGVTFFMIDLDDFKFINDRYGHAVGDQVLQAFAERLKIFCRAGDILVRWGGEEFLLVAAGFDCEVASRMAERICSTVADAPLIDLPDGTCLAIRCSVGFSVWLPPGDSLEEISWELAVSLADMALYAAKHAGKNTWRGVVPESESAFIRIGQARLSTNDPEALARDGLVRLIAPE